MNFIKYIFSKKGLRESCLFLAVFVIWILTPIFLNYFVDAGSRGTVGDMYGTINSLFSGLAFAGIIYSLVLQRKELRYQRLELKLTRKELAGQKDALEEQCASMERSTNLNSLISRVDILLQLKEKVCLQIAGTNPKGLEAFSAGAQTLINKCSQNVEPQTIYEHFFFGTMLGFEPVAKLVVSTLVFIDMNFKGDGNETEFEEALSLWSSQFSSDELILLYVYYHGSEKHLAIRGLANESGFFQNVEENDIAPFRRIVESQG